MFCNFLDDKYVSDKFGTSNFKRGVTNFEKARVI
jgi:hypothetical protein